MPSEEEIARRKHLTRSVAEKQRAAAEARMPISRQDLRDLFDFLDESLGAEGCNHSLEHTKSFLLSRKLDEVAIVPWLGEYGGFCDCEVLANVEDAWPQ